MFLGFGIGPINVLMGPHQVRSFLGSDVGMDTLYGLIRVGHVSEAMQMNSIIRWVLLSNRLAFDPVSGIGFADAKAEFGSTTGPHNSYIRPLLNTCVIAGSLIYVLNHGITRRWPTWSGFVVRVIVFAYMTFKSHFPRGLSVSSIVLGLFIRRMIAADPYEDEEKSRPVTTRRALKTNRTARAFEHIPAISIDRNRIGTSAGLKREN